MTKIVHVHTKIVTTFGLLTEDGDITGKREFAGDLDVLSPESLLSAYNSLLQTKLDLQAKADAETEAPKSEEG